MEACVASAYHVEQDSIYGTVVVGVRNHVIDPILCSETPCVLIVGETSAVAVILTIDKHDVDANRRGFVREVACDFEEDTYTATAIVGPQDGLIAVLDIHVGPGACVPVSKENNATALNGVERANYVGQREAVAVKGLDDSILNHHSVGVAADLSEKVICASFVSIRPCLL